LINPTVSGAPAPTIPWSEVTVICRRVCVLEAQGRTDEAERLRASLPADERVASILAAETERVANAVVLAELLMPLLAENPATERVSVSARRETPTRSATPSSVPPAPPAVPARASPATIADFIDEMLAQEGPPGPLRRAS
jgi:hypothetical protein